MRLTLQIWRQPDTAAPGRYEDYTVDDATPEMSLLELLDRLNDALVAEGREPVAFDSDCREGVCGSCGITVDGRPHGPLPNTPSCRQHVRSFADGARIRFEPFRSAAFPVVRDLVVDRSALDRMIAAGGNVAVDAGTAGGRRRRTPAARRGRVRAGFRGVHRMRRLRRGLSERVRTPVRRRQAAAPGHRYPGPSGTQSARARCGRADGEGLRTLFQLRRMLQGVSGKHSADRGGGRQP